MCDLHISYWFYFTKIIILLYYIPVLTGRIVPNFLLMSSTCCNERCLSAFSFPFLFWLLDEWAAMCRGIPHDFVFFRRRFFHAVLVNDFDISSTIWYILCKADLILLKQPKLLLTEMIQSNKKYLNWNNLPMNEKNENCRLPLSS